VLAEADVKIRNGFKIGGIAPPDLASYDQTTRKLYWSWVLKLALARKDKELAQGLDKDGKPLRPIAPATRKHRRSAMTPSGKGDPAAPPLMPGYQKSRTRSLLAGRALSTHVDLFWKFDAWTGESWSVVLSYQAARGRDVFGLSQEGLAWLKVKSWAMWDQWKAGTLRTIAEKPAKRPGVPKFGRYAAEHVDYGVSTSGNTGPPSNAKAGTWTGFSTPAERAAYFRQTAAASLPGRAANPGSKSPIVGPRYNRLLAHVWGRAGGAALGGSPAKGPRITPPKTPKTPKTVAPPLSPLEAARQAQRAQNEAAAAARPTVIIPRTTSEEIRNYEKWMKEAQDSAAEIERKMLEGAADWARIRAEFLKMREKMWDYSLSAKTRKTWENKFEALKKSPEYDRLQNEVMWGPDRARYEKQRYENYRAKLAEARANLEPIKIEYAKNLANHPDLIAPGPIQERLGKYTLGDAKVAEIKKVHAATEAREAQLATDRARLNKEIDAAQLRYAELMGRSRTAQEHEELIGLDAAMTAQNQALGAVKAEQRALIADRRLAVNKILEVDPANRLKFAHAAADADAYDVNIAADGTITKTPMIPPTAKTVENADAAVDWMTRTIAKGDGQFADQMTQKLGEIRGARAHHRTNDPNAKYHILVADAESADVIVHEFGHGIDEGVKIGDDFVVKRSLEFREYRLKGEEPIELNTKFSWYDAGERGAKDEFEKAFSESSAYYVGKDYGTRATEILSMGIQKLYNDPVNFVVKDPEYAKFILGIMDGSLR
jgi:hypothetical protein